MAKRARTRTLEEATREFIKWETGQYDSLPRKFHEKAMEQWEQQGDFGFIEKANSARTLGIEQYEPPNNAKAEDKQGSKSKEIRKRKISEEKRRTYMEFYHDARRYENTDISRSVPEKRHLLINYFPHQFTVVQPLDNYVPATLGSLFSRLLKYAETITEETIAMAQAQQAQQ